MINTGQVTKENVDRNAWLAVAEKIGQIAEAESREADQNGRFSPKVAEAILEGGINKLMRPKQYGGTFVDLRTFTDIVRTVAKHSVAASWLTNFYAVHDIWPSYLPPKGRDVVLGHNGLIADVVAPLGRAEKDGDGYRLFGQWNFASGVLWSDYVGLGSMIDITGEGPEYCIAVVSTSDPDVKIIENWDTLGLRSTGSNGIHVDGAYIPEHLLVPAKYLFEIGKPMGGDYDPEDPVYRMPFMQLFLVGFPATALGAMERLIGIFKERTEKRIRVFNGGTQEKNAAGSQRLLAEMNIQYRAAEGLLNRYIEILEEWQAEGKTVVGDEERAEIYSIRAQVARMAADMALKVILTLGGTSIFKGDPVELFTRDVIAFASHPTNLWEDAMSAYGRTQFGGPAHPVW
ncbi:acyl-CoA dehydrogenase [Neobacillus cucumis]|uniref:acyl-CoA dehydrogenase n=1 Tax=Neobacillus cucumis TaxID=1740721 RepID=UPI00203D6621|nr:acyl-CoA dehydrogenase [Neobacillus cucumis]MCM3725019.1 acyl-CoA dehydrogenase [Neobacillus cucumis]